MLVQRLEETEYVHTTHRRATLVGLVLAMLALGRGGPAAPRPARASFPGANGPIVFWALPVDNFEIFRVNPDGTQDINLTNNPANDEMPSVSPDGGRIVFVRDDRQVYVMNIDGSGQRRLFELPAGAPPVHDPTWSPDGASVVFSEGDADGGLMVWDGSKVSRLTARGEHPSWSPDGSTIAFDAGDDLWTVPATGGAPSKLLATEAVEYQPSWSPDGSTIAYVQGYPAAPTAIWFVDASGQNARVFQQPGDNEYLDDPAFAPEGGQVVYMSGVRTCSRIAIGDGSGETIVSDCDKGGAFSPDWGPVAGTRPPTPTPQETASTGTTPLAATGSEGRSSGARTVGLIGAGLLAGVVSIGLALQTVLAPAAGGTMARRRPRRRRGRGHAGCVGRWKVAAAAGATARSRAAGELAGALREIARRWDTTSDALERAAGAFEPIAPQSPARPRAADPDDPAAVVARILDGLGDAVRARG